MIMRRLRADQFGWIITIIAPLYGASLVAVHMGLGGPTGGRTGGVPFLMRFSTMGMGRRLLLIMNREHHMANQYWLKRDGKMYGPYSGGKLKKLAGEGKIGPDDLISADKRLWQRAETVRGLLLQVMAKPPQTASAVIAPHPMEVSPRTGNGSRAHHRRKSLSKYDQQYPDQSFRSWWLVIGAAAIGLVVALAVWTWMPRDESIPPELAQSNENSQDEVHSPGKPDVTRTSTPPATPKAATKPPNSHKRSPRVTVRSPQTAGGNRKPGLLSKARGQKPRLPFLAADIDEAIVWGKPTRVVNGWRCYDAAGRTVIKARDAGGKLEIGLRRDGFYGLFLIHLFSSRLFTPVEYDKLMKMIGRRSSTVRW
jgi:hypothetical protein